MNASPEPPRYGVPARLLHGLMALLLFMQVPVGIVMSYRGNVLNLWNAVTDFLYSAHKSIGFVLLILLLLRALFRLTAGAPPPEPSLAPWQRRIAAANHAGLYLFLLVVPMLGWLGVSLFPAREVFGVVSLPAISGVDRAASGRRLHAARSGGIPAGRIDRAAHCRRTAPPLHPPRQSPAADVAVRSDGRICGARRHRSDG